MSILSGTRSGLSSPLGGFACVIFAGVIAEAVLDADGLCGKSDDGTLFFVIDFEIPDILFVDLAIGRCVEVEPFFGVAVAELEDATRRMFVDLQERGLIPEDDMDKVQLQGPSEEVLDLME